MAIKLIKACKELNIGMSTAIEFCKTQGVNILADPNARIDDDLYLLLAKVFNQEVALKLEAERAEELRQWYSQQRDISTSKEKKDSLVVEMTKQTILPDNKEEQNTLSDIIMMSQDQIYEIKAIIHNLAITDGWALLAQVGLKLKENGIDYGDGLKLFFQQLTEHFELKNSPGRTPKDPPVFHVRVKNNSDTRLKKQLIKSGKNKFDKNNPELLDWAYLPQGWNGTIELLYKFIRQDEHWYYGEKQENQTSLPILSNYLRYTFVRIYKEDKIRYSVKGADRQLAAFNTGLVNDLYEPIYALFEKNKIEGQQEWFLLGFSPRESGIGKGFLGNIDGIPPRAKYITEKDLLIPDGMVPSIDVKHIVDNLERLPNDYLWKLCKDLVSSKAELEESKGTQEFKDKIRNNIEKVHDIKRDFEHAIRMSLKRVEWNYKTAIPVYWVKGNSISLLLPLALTDGKEIDLAFVISRQENGSYVGQTIYTLEMAYNDARLIVRPDSDWLIPSMIKRTAKVSNPEE